MVASSASRVIVIGAGISGIVAAKVLAQNGISDFIILEAANRIGGRIANTPFGGVTVESGAGWIAGVGGQHVNPIWEVANDCNLRTCFSDYSHARFNIYDSRGNKVARSVAEASYEVAVNAANRVLAVEASGQEEALDEKDSFVPSTSLELAIDYALHDFEMAEVEPIPTYTEFGEKEFMVADERGYDYVVQKLAKEFLHSDSNGRIVDSRLKLQKVVREIKYTDNGVIVTTEDGSIYNGKYCIVSVSLGVLRSDLITFQPKLPRWKTSLFSECDIRVYTKIFLKFSRKFWPTEDGTEFFLYAHEKRGYYTFWQHMENVYPGSNILMVTVTDEESKRIENQPDDKTKAEAMQVLRNIFGNEIPEAEEILVPKWWNNRFQRGSYSNYPILVNRKHFQDLKEPVGPIYFAGEHTSEKFNGYVHGAYLSGIDTANMVVESIESTQNNKYLISYSPPRVSQRKKVPVVAGLCSLQSTTTKQLKRILKMNLKKKMWVDKHNLIAYSSPRPTASWV